MGRYLSKTGGDTNDAALAVVGANGKPVANPVRDVVFQASALRTSLYTSVMAFNVADLVLGLEDDHGHALLGEQVAGGQAGGAAAEDGDRRTLGRAALARDDFELNSGHARHLVHWRAPAHARLTAANTP